MEILIFLFGVIFVIRLQPVFIIRRIIFITFIYSLCIYIELGTYWFRYLLLIVILRGVLVVFTYIITLIPNESFEIIGLLFIVIFIFINVVSFKKRFFVDIRLERINLWNRYLGIFNIFMIRLLLVVILIVVFLRNIHFGSFRIN